MEYLLDLTLSSEDGEIVPRRESDLKVYNMLDPHGRQKLREQPAPVKRRQIKTELKRST